MLASFPSPPVNSFYLGPLQIHFYGVLIAIGVALAFVVARRRFEAMGGDGDVLERILIWTVIAGFVGARAAYVSTHFYRFDGRPWAVLFVWEGGLAFFGGLTLGAITAIGLARRWGLDVAKVADAVVVGIPLAQAIGRWGNYFNQELFGTPTNLPWAVQIDPAHRPEQFAGFATFHPTFLYESLYNLLIVGVLLYIDRRRDLRRGSLLGVYAILYGTMRFLVELIRTDTTFRFLGLSRNGWVSLLLIVAAAIGLRWWERRGDTTGPGDADRDGGEDDADPREDDPRDDDPRADAPQDEDASTTTMPSPGSAPPA